MKQVAYQKDKILKEKFAFKYSEFVTFNDKSSILWLEKTQENKKDMLLQTQLIQDIHSTVQKERAIFHPK